MSRRLIIAVSGTPGTGKSLFAAELAKKIGAELVDLNTLIKESGIYEVDENGVRVVDPEDLRREFSRVSKEVCGDLVVEGLLAHLLPTDEVTHVVVLRTAIEELERRLLARGYPERKLRENLEAEALGIILCEAVQEHGEDKVHEIDTTSLDPPEAVKLFLSALRGEVSLRPGKIDWLEEYCDKYFRSETPRGGKKFNP